jgi:phenylpyruvate tautomerase PptA (4-oxalocrotonate tautomerase family)
MSNKNKAISQWAFYILIGVLLFYAASRTLHFVQGVMANSTWGYLFLFSTGIGALIWLYVYLTYAEGAKQRGIAFVMGLVDLVGELALVYADTMYVGEKAGLVKMTPDEMQLFIVVSVAMVGINIFAGYLFKLWDLRAEQEQHAQDLVDHVTDATMKHLNTPEAKQQMVQELLPVLKNSIAARVQSEIFSRASQTAGLDARSVGWPMADSKEKKEEVVPMAAPGFLERLKDFMPGREKQVNNSMVWTTDGQGNRVRILCMTCQREGKPWMTPEPCDHILNAQGQSGNVESAKSILSDSLEGDARS